MRTAALSGFALEQYRDELARAAFLKARLSLVLRCYGAYMVKAERSFNQWMGSFVSGPVHEARYQDYLKWSSKAARMHARHTSLASRVLGGAMPDCSFAAIPDPFDMTDREVRS